MGKGNRAKQTRKRREENRQNKAKAASRKPRSFAKEMKQRERDWDVIEVMPHHARLRRIAEGLAPHGAGHAGGSARARSVLNWINLAQGRHVPGAHLPQNARNSGYTPPKIRNSRHFRPDREYEIERQRLNEAMPDASTKAARALAKRVELGALEATPEEGVGRGLLHTAAEFYTDEVTLAHGTFGEHPEIHRAATTQYFEQLWGMAVHAYPNHIDLPGYHEWRERSLRNLGLAA